ncbi:sensor domain-containing diguanylate cyclase [Fusobacterium ulcerans]|uniref:Diguanylate cyclase (GGDEF) domain-containing protein n=1 Tax=Fusobacterium ulcerans 12-1B TaxID=457404 RepID=H1PRQ4_9FUSO|nr:sensor domain-containing diguanylate cyclase [Fusobacterium ulcerans]EHO83067.1 diguanylate cyclase (GGDEF) domain-containing protein [Fusobacterium ulcerans 12-1B]
MKRNKLLKTNILVSIILIVGFSLTAMLSYQANYKASLDNIEQVSSLTAEGIYYQLTSMFAKPVNVSLTMAHDSLLVNHLSEEEKYFGNEKYIQTIQKYLKIYQERYGFDSVFLASAITKNYYNFRGLDRVLNKDNPENIWFFSLLESNQDYSLNIDNDEVKGADNAITVFVNCKVKDHSGNVLGIIGVGMRIEHLKELLLSYEKKFKLETYLIDKKGIIEISTTYTGYEEKNWFEIYGQNSIKKDILAWKEDFANLEMWTESSESPIDKNYIVTRYIPELSWHLIVKQNTGRLISEMRHNLFQVCLIITFIILIVLVVITAVIRNFNKQITKLVEEREAVFRRSTEQLYDNINELNITENTYIGENTVKYFESIGAKGLPYDQGLFVIAERQIKEEYREGYVSIFSPKNVIREYEKGNRHLRYEFMTLQDEENYIWMRVDAYIFYSPEDNSIHMFTYRKNINEEKKKEEKAEIDEMTGFYNKKATERLISKKLLKSPTQKYALFIFDIDNFKQANDNYGHLFGDSCIKEFTRVIKESLGEESTIMGRVGGDEFVVFTPIINTEWVDRKAKEVSKALNIKYENNSSSWDMSASIGIAVTPEAGKEFKDIYRNADTALYQTKEKGKNGYTIYRKAHLNLKKR